MPPNLCPMKTHFLKSGDFEDPKYNSVRDAAIQLGGAASIKDVFVGFQKYLYEDDQHDKLKQ